MVSVFEEVQAGRYQMTGVTGTDQDKSDGEYNNTVSIMVTLRTMLSRGLILLAGVL